jgi:hypothetical protein
VTYGWNGFEPTTPVELWQERREEMYARAEVDERFDVLCDEPTERPADGEAEETDLVTPLDRWLWGTEAWWRLDTSRLHLMTPEERDRHTEPVKRYVDAKAFEKRFEKWVDGGCPMEDSNREATKTTDSKRRPTAEADDSR